MGSASLELERVREQLQHELGYDASSFSDEVLRAVLADLTLSDWPTAKPLVVPTAAKDPFGPEEAGEDEDEEYEAYSRETSRRFGAQPRAVASSGDGTRRAMRLPVDIPTLTPTGRQRPATAPRPSTAPLRPSSARSAPRTPQSEPRPRTGSLLGLEGSASGVGFIVRTTAQPGRVKTSDPVAMRQQRERQWQSNAFLKSMASPRHRHEPVASTMPGMASLDSYRVYHDRVSPQAKPQTAYKVPTEKRRDAVVWETRERLRREHEPHRSKFSQLFVRNTYVPPTSQRRSKLRWQVRSELAVVY
mmetsp:Transcript_7111/g.18539  ORF Transcript_7111/g.18539 Transcript_7111/m.18539 type:complete len:303 (-) Transcript_7111:478-1386(-)